MYESHARPALITPAPVGFGERVCSAPATRYRSTLAAALALEHALQDFEIASVVDDETPSLGVDPRGAPQRLRECRLESPDIGIGIEGQFVGRMPGGPCTADPTSLRRRLGLSHRKPVSDDSLGQALLATRVLHRHERPRVAGRELASDNEMLDSHRKLQQTQRVGDVSTGLAERVRKASDCPVTPPAVAGAQSLEVRLELARLLNRIRAPCCARQRQDRLGFLVGDVVANVDRDLAPPGALRGEPCLGVGQDFVARAVRTDHDRIDRPVRLETRADSPVADPLPCISTRIGSVP